MSSRRFKTFTQIKYSLLLSVVLCLVFMTSCVHCIARHDDRIKKPLYLEGRVGSHVIFNCPIEFPQETPIPYVLHWNKDEKPVFSWYDGVLTATESYVGRIALIDDIRHGRTAVNLTSIQESDNGWYECKVIFPNRSPNSRGNGTWFHLAVDGGTLLRIPPINQTVLEGDSAFFRCEPKNFETMTVDWFKDDEPFEGLYDLLRRATKGPDGSITISPTQMSDLGRYKCRIRNNFGEEQESEAFLNVQYKAKVVYTPLEVYLPYGLPAILDCHFRSNPPLTNLRWEKDGFLFDPYNVQGVFYKRNGSLYFSQVNDTHAGRYSCTPYNELGTEGPSPIINVIVQRPPTFTIKPKQVYLTKLGATVQMHCDARDRDGRHIPTLQWVKKDGTPLPHGRYQLDGGNITLEEIQESDRGIYACEAINEAATINADAEIMIENVSPRAPYNLTANSSDTAITLKWAPGYLRQYLEYAVWYRLADVQEWRTLRVARHHMLEVTIKELEPAKEYEFMVLCQDPHGDGMFSKSYRYFTKPSKYTEPEELKDPIEPFQQIGPPRNLSVSRHSHAYVAEWEQPEYGMDQFRFYILKWWKEPQHRQMGQVETADTYYILDEIVEDETYVFQVVALSTTNYTSGSNEYEIFIYPYRRVKVLTITGVIGIFLCLTTAGIVLYMKRNRIQRLREAHNVKI